MNTPRFMLETLTRLLEKESWDVLLIEGFHAQVSRRSDIFKVVAAKDENNEVYSLFTGTRSWVHSNESKAPNG